MAGRKPIFATLVSSLYWGVRDFFFKLILEPASHQDRKEKEAKKKNK